MKKRLLLHCCCAPCAAYVLECLTPLYECAIFFYNPNIEPALEYDKRKAELHKLITRNSLLSRIELIDSDYNNAVFADLTGEFKHEPEGETRCGLCYELRLRETASRASAGKYNIFATTLSVSPHKNAGLLNEIGTKLAGEFNIEYLVSDFKKQDGYKRSVELSKEYGLYRQIYCGCNSSMNSKTNLSAENK